MNELDTLIDERAQLVATAGRLLDKSKANGGKWVAEDEQEYDRLHDEADKVLAKINAKKATKAREDRHRQSQESLAESRGRRAAANEPGRAGAVRQMPEFRGRQLVLPPDANVRMRAGEEYAEAFEAYLAGRQPAATLQTDIASDGGYLAPPQFVAELVAELDNEFWFRSLARVLPPTSAPKVTMPRRTSRASAFQWGTEISTAPVLNTPKYGTYNLTPHYMSGEFELSKDLIGAGMLSAESLLRDEINYNAMDLEETVFFYGDGTGRPLGVFTPSAQGIPTSRDVSKAAATFFADADPWIDAKTSIKPQYLKSGSFRWIIHRLILRRMMKLKDSTGQPIWIVSTRDGEPDRVLGVPVIISEYAPKASGANDTIVAGDYLGILGDFRQYTILDGLDLGVTRHTDSNFERRNMVGFIVRRKVDGGVRDENAFARLIAS